MKSIITLSILLMGMANIASAGTINLSSGDVMRISANNETTVTCNGEAGSGEGAIVAKICECVSSYFGTYVLNLTLVNAESGKSVVQLGTYGNKEECLEAKKTCH